MRLLTCLLIATLLLTSCGLESPESTSYSVPADELTSYAKEDNAYYCSSNIQVLEPEASYSVPADGLLSYVEDDNANYCSSDIQVLEPEASEQSADNKNPIFVRGAEVRTVSLISSGGLSSFHVKFPQINDFADENFVNINRIIYDIIVTYGKVNGREYNLFAFEDTWIDIDISYNTTYASDDLLSFHFYGSITGGGVGTRGFVDIQKAINIDLDNGGVLSLGDFFTYEEVRHMIDSILIDDNIKLIGFGSTIESWRQELLHELYVYFSNSLSNGQLLDDTRYFYIREGRVGLIGWYGRSPSRRMIVEVCMG